MESAITHVKTAPLIAVIEDEEAVLAGYQMLFESWGFRVVAAPSATEAMSGLSRTGEPPAFILADFRLREGHTGVEAIAALRDTFGPAIPGMLVTGDTGIERLRQAAASGLPILHKPVSSRQLKDALDRALGK